LLQRVKNEMSTKVAKKGKASSGRKVLIGEEKVRNLKKNGVTRESKKRWGGKNERGKKCIL